jgi:hypothetical protein
MMDGPDRNQRSEGLDADARLRRVRDRFQRARSRQRRAESKLRYFGSVAIGFAAMLIGTLFIVDIAGR